MKNWLNPAYFGMYSSRPSFSMDCLLNKFVCEDLWKSVSITQIKSVINPFALQNLFTFFQLLPVHITFDNMSHDTAKPTSGMCTR